MEPQEMAKLLPVSRRVIQARREAVRQRDSPEEQAERLLRNLRALARVPDDLVPGEVEECETVVASDSVLSAGQDAMLVEFYSDDPRQIELAGAIRVACRKALKTGKYCVFVREVLPLIHQIAEGVELPPLTPPNPKRVNV